MAFRVHPYDLVDRFGFNLPALRAASSTSTSTLREPGRNGEPNALALAHRGSGQS
jgi:hypothetical protein